MITSMILPAHRLVQDLFKTIDDGQSPSYMVSETDSEYRIEMSLPGYRKQELSMSVEKGYLTVTSNPVSDGRIFGSQKFNKRFRIPSQVDTDSISAEYKDGVLVISIPKSRTSMKTSVTIK